MPRSRSIRLTGKAEGEPPARIFRMHDTGGEPLFLPDLSRNVNVLEPRSITRFQILIVVATISPTTPSCCSIAVLCNRLAIKIDRVLEIA